jgi:hypothetical protein
VNAVLIRSAQPGHARRERWLVPVVAGIGFTLSWVIGLVLPVPNLAVTAPASEVIARYGPHLGLVQAQFALTEGLPAVGLAVITVFLARAAGRAAGRGRARVIMVSGLLASVISLAQYALGVMLAGWALPGHASGRTAVLFQAVNRLDGAKMLALAVLAAATLALTGPALTGPALTGPGGPLPRWLRYASLALAVSITVSGAGYLFLIEALAPVAYVAGLALLVWVTDVGVALGRASGRPARKQDACRARG